MSFSATILRPSPGTSSIFEKLRVGDFHVAVVSGGFTADG